MGGRATFCRVCKERHEPRADCPVVASGICCKLTVHTMRQLRREAFVEERSMGSIVEEALRARYDGGNEGG